MNRKMNTDVAFGVSVGGKYFLIDRTDWLDRDKPFTLLTKVLVPPFCAHVPLEELPPQKKQSVTKLANELARSNSNELAALRAMLAWSVVMGDVPPTETDVASLSSETLQRLATLDVDRTIDISWETIRHVWRRPWRIVGEMSGKGADTIDIIPTWNHGIRANTLDERSIWTFLHALIEDVDMETLVSLVDHARLRALVGLSDSRAGDAAVGAASTPLSSSTAFVAPQWVTTPFGWIRVGSRVRKRTASE